MGGEDDINRTTQRTSSRSPKDKPANHQNYPQHSKNKMEEQSITAQLRYLTEEIKSMSRSFSNLIRALEEITPIKEVGQPQPENEGKLSQELSNPVDLGRGYIS